MMENYNAGIARQMHWELESAREAGLDHDVLVFCSDQVKEKYNFLKRVKLYARFKLVSYVKIRLTFYMWLHKNYRDYDCVLVRYSTANIFQAAFSYSWRNVATVHHTKEGFELKATLGAGLLRLILIFLESILSKITLSNTMGFVAVTKEILEYEESRTKITKGKLFGLVYPNGCARAAIAVRPKSNKKRKIGILFVATEFSNWHGLDLLLDSVRLYQGEVEFTIHIVGSLNGITLGSLEHDNRIKVHGVQRPDVISKLCSICDVGLSSFALFRQNMNSACTLKVREYLASGLPVYCGYTEEGFPEDFQFCRQGGPDIDSILNYCLEMKSYTPSQVRNDSLRYISKTELLTKLHLDLAAALPVKAR